MDLKVPLLSRFRVEQSNVTRGNRAKAKSRHSGEARISVLFSDGIQDLGSRPSDYGMFAGMRAFLLAFVLLFRLSALAQDCPRQNPNGSYMESTSRTLNGRVVFHNDLRQWISLELDAPVCGERTVELFMHDEKGEWTPALQAFRGCLVTTAGALGLPVTGYYSAEIFQDVEKIEPDPNCIRQPLIPDYEKAKPARGIRSYQVKMWFDYLAPQGPVHAIITTDHGVVRPWQAYAHYYLTGGFVFYAYCADKFWMYRLTATPQAKPRMMDNYAVIDPETAGEKHVRRIQLSYRCRR